MNTQIQLSENQQDSRINKGYNAYLEGKVSKLENIPRLYEVIGSKGEIRIVEDLTMEGEDINEFYTCSCPDHEYRKVVCYHQIAVQFFKLSNGAWRDMTHYYDENDRDMYYCDSCDITIIGNVYNKHGKIPKTKPRFWKNDEHYCNECINSE